MKKHYAWKAYYITCSLLSQFKGGCSMEGEHVLFIAVLEWVLNPKKRDALINELDFVFGMGEKQLKLAEKDFKSHEKICLAH